MKQLRNIVAPIFLLCLMLVAGLPVFAQTQEDVTPQEQKENTVDVKEIVFGHIGDSYEWHITTWGKTHITIPLPIIVYSSTTGWHTFLLPVSLRMEALMKGSPSPPKEVSTKANWWSIMQPESRFVRGIFPLRR